MGFRGAKLKGRPHSSYATAQLVIIIIIIIIILVYFRLVVNTDGIIDTRAQKMVYHTVAQSAHDHGEEQNTLSSPQLHCHLQEHEEWLE